MFYFLVYKIICTGIMEAQVPDPMRRTTRSALAEIPVRLGLLRVTPLTPPATPTNNLAQNLLRNTLTPTTLNVSGNTLSPVLSPDELIIQQRGDAYFLYCIALNVKYILVIYLIKDIVTSFYVINQL